MKKQKQPYYASDRSFDRDRVARAARIYHSNKYAAEAMGISTKHVRILCCRFGLETPDQRRAGTPRAAVKGRHTRLAQWMRSA